MLITVLAENSHIRAVGFEGEEIRFHASVQTEPRQTSDYYILMLTQLFTLYGVSGERITGVVLASVVPQLTPTLIDALARIAGSRHKLLSLSSGIKTGLNIQMENPAQIGSDLIVAAVAALSRFEPPLIIIDMGTATTITAIDKTGTYVGGCISPGPKISAEALSARTAQLPAISLESPKKAIGKNTIDAMRSGVMLGSACMVDGMIDRIDAELGGGATVVATGGIARFVLPMCRHAIEYDRDLLLKGLALLYENNRREK